MVLGRAGKATADYLSGLDGQHYLLVRAIDQTGNANGRNTPSFQLDSTLLRITLRDTCIIWRIGEVPCVIGRVA